MVAQRLSNHGSSYWLSSRLIFPCDFKTNGMLFPDYSFCFYEINTWPLPPKNCTILSQKIKRLEQCKVAWVDCKYGLDSAVNSRRLQYFSSKLQDENSQLDWSNGLPHVQNYLECQFKVVWCLQVKYFSQKTLRGQMVAQQLSNHGSSYWSSSRLIFSYDFKTNGMLFPN